jgi:transposase
VLALLPPRLWGRAKAAAAYAGLIPEREESAFSKGTSPSAKEAFHGSLGGGAARPGDGGLLPRLLWRGKRNEQALVAVAHKLLRRMMGRLRASYAGRSLQGVA